MDKCAKWNGLYLHEALRAAQINETGNHGTEF